MSEEATRPAPTIRTLPDLVAAKAGMIGYAPTDSITVLATQNSSVGPILRVDIDRENPLELQLLALIGFLPCGFTPENTDLFIGIYTTTPLSPSDLTFLNRVARKTGYTVRETYNATSSGVMSADGDIHTNEEVESSVCALELKMYPLGNSINPGTPLPPLPPAHDDEELAPGHLDRALILHRFNELERDAYNTVIDAWTALIADSATENQLLLLAEGLELHGGTGVWAAGATLAVGGIVRPIVRDERIVGKGLVFQDAQPAVEVAERLALKVAPLMSNSAQVWSFCYWANWVAGLNSRADKFRERFEQTTNPQVHTPHDVINSINEGLFPYYLR